MLDHRGLAVARPDDGVAAVHGSGAGRDDGERQGEDQFTHTHSLAGLQDLYLVTISAKAAVIPWEPSRTSPRRESLFRLS